MSASNQEGQFYSLHEDMEEGIGKLAVVDFPREELPIFWGTNHFTFSFDGADDETASYGDNPEAKTNQADEDWNFGSLMRVPMIVQFYHTGGAVSSDPDDPLNFAWRTLALNQVTNFRDDYPEPYKYYSWTESVDDFFFAPFKDRFFGPKMLLIIILDEAYDLPLGNEDEALEQFKILIAADIKRMTDRIDEWSALSVIVYYDPKPAELGGTNPNGYELVIQAYKELIEANVDFGFIWKGLIDRSVDYRFFKPIMDDFFNYA